MATITGFIEKIKFRNEENGYTVLSVTDQSDGDEVIMVGTLSYAAEGDMIQASGRMIEHPVYGEQLQIESYEMKTPQDAESMERYLGSGAIKGIGAALAARIVRHFKADTFRVMEEEPERLSEVKGISEKMAMAIAEQVEEKKGMREAMMFLQNYGITLNLAAKIYQEYGPKLYSIIKENPYKLADDIPGVGFKMADEIAEKVGIFTGYYFYYEPQRVTVLDYTFLATITEKTSGTIIYADRCSIAEDKLAQMGIVFKKIPRDISRL